MVSYCIPPPERLTERIPKNPMGPSPSSKQGSETFQDLQDAPHAGEHAGVSVGIESCGTPASPSPALRTS